jgi:hypothetical protein
MSPEIIKVDKTNLVFNVKETFDSLFDLTFWMLLLETESTKRIAQRL